MADKKWIYIVLFFLTFLYGNVRAQDTARTVCSQNLIDAQALFAAGKLNQVEAKLQGCLADKKGGFTKDERIQAFKLLSVTYTYLEEYAKADEAVLNLLRTENEYTVNPEIDPTEFIRLYQKFRTYPIFQVGIHGSLAIPNFTFGYTYENSGMETNAGEFKWNIGFSAGLDFEIPLRTIDERFILCPSVIYSNLSYTETLSPQTGANTIGTVSGTEVESRVGVPVLGRYNFRNRAGQKYIPFVEGGGVVSYLISAEFTQPSGLIANNFVQPAPIDFKVNRNMLNYGAVIGGGVMTDIPMGIIELRLDYCYNINQTNIIQPLNNSAINTLISEPQFHMHNITLSIGYMRKIYKPKKMVE